MADKNHMDQEQHSTTNQTIGPALLAASAAVTASAISTWMLARWMPRTEGIAVVLACMLILLGIAAIIRSQQHTALVPRCGGCGYEIDTQQELPNPCTECGRDYRAVGIRAPGSPAVNQRFLLAGIAAACFGATVLISGVVLAQ